MRLARSLVACAVLCAVAAVGAAEPEEAGAYVGQETCVRCHADDSHAYGLTVHGRALTPGVATTPLMERGCESCHGPGQAHAASGGRVHEAGGWLTFAEDDPDAATRKAEACLQCHQGSTQRYWHGSAHPSHGLDCGSCHTVMKQVSERHLLSRPTEAEVCSQCHHLPGAQSRRASHMPNRTGVGALGAEGFMSCASCHNPHGSVAESLIDAHTINDSCTSCHAEKRGPFLWEHAPVSENCLSCHVAHGSIKPNLLRISAPRLCQTCHIEVLHVSEARVPGSRFVAGQSCMNCHSQVHGSNHPSGVFLTR